MLKSNDRIETTNQDCELEKYLNLVESPLITQTDLSKREVNKNTETDFIEGNLIKIS